jgi:hypothetical protein
VDQLVGRVELPQIAARLTERFGVERSVPGVVSRLKRRARSQWAEGLSVHDLERIFHVDHRAILRWWVEPGLLAGRRWPGRGRRVGWLFTTEVVQAFVRQHAYAFDAARMQPGHALTRLAKVESRVQAWRTCRDLAAYLGVSCWTVTRAVRDGLVPHQRCRGAGRYGEIRVRASDFPAIKERLAAMREPARRRRNPERPGAS